MLTFLRLAQVRTNPISFWYNFVRYVFAPSPDGLVPNPPLPDRSVGPRTIGGRLVKSVQQFKNYIRRLRQVGMGSRAGAGWG